MSARDREHVQVIHGLNCGCVYHLQERAVAAAKAQAATSELAPKPATVAAPPVISSLHVTPNSGTVSKARKRGRPRVLSDEQRRERVRQRVAGWRAAKAGKAVGS